MPWMTCPTCEEAVVGVTALRAALLAFFDNPAQPYALVHEGHEPAEAVGAVALLDLWRDGLNLLDTLSTETWWIGEMADGVRLAVGIAVEYPEPTPRTPAQRRGWRRAR